MEDLLTGSRGSASWAEKSLVLSVESFQTCPTLEALWTVARQAPLSMGILPGKNTGVGCHPLLQGPFLTQRSNPSLMSPALENGFFTTGAIWEAPLLGGLASPELPVLTNCTITSCFVLFLPCSEDNHSSNTIHSTPLTSPSAVYSSPAPPHCPGSAPHPGHQIVTRAS